MDLTYLREILNLEGDHANSINGTMIELINHANSLKNSIKKIVENESVQFNSLLKENNKLQARAQDLINEMIIIQDKVEKEIKLELGNCTSEIETLSFSLKEINLFLKILKQLLQIDSSVKKAKIHLNCGEYYKCAQTIFSIQEEVKIYNKKLEQINIYKALSQEIILTKEQLLHKISETWSDCVYIATKENSSKNLLLITLFIKIKSIKNITEVIKASLHLNSNLAEKKFSYSLLNDILIKIITKKSKVITNVDDDATLFIEVLNTEEKPHYLEVFDNLKTLIEFLKFHMNFEIQNGEKFLFTIGSYISSEFAENLIKHCLSETIPSSSEDLNTYKNVIKNAEDFEKVLQSIGFLSKDSSSILDYANNINVLFANKFCQKFLNKARNICKKDLHNTTMSEEVESNISLLPSAYGKILKDKMNIHEEIFLFPKCQISKQADELINLINLMIKEIEKSEDLCAVRLFYSVRNIFEMYAAIVPLHHQKFLETLPQQVALFHNNCMYFAHKLINITIEFQKKIPSILKDHLTVLLEEAVVLRSLAAERLEKTVTNQKNQLIYILRDSGFALLNENPTLDPNSEKSIRQCMRQLQVLQTVWIDVLFISIYNRAIGFLLDALVEELINLILAVEDISSQTASKLVSNFTIVLERTPSLFLDGKEIHRHTRKWQKFKEFVLIINGNLRDIDDRWANGLGPLAVEFTAEQVKHLIRALFQNSDRRAALLARIR